mgnify:CR=1 FL=1
MAKKGIEYAVFGLLDEKGGTYSGGKYLSPVVNFNGSPTKANASDYGDNRALETDNSVTGGTLSIELNNDEDELYVFLLGHEKAEGGEISYNVNDDPPYVGCGAVGKSGGKDVVKFYTKVQFGEPNDDNTSRQENTTYNHVTLEGAILIPENGEWKIRKTFDTLEAAKGWLNEKVGIAAAE